MHWGGKWNKSLWSYFCSCYILEVSTITEPRFGKQVFHLISVFGVGDGMCDLEGGREPQPRSAVWARLLKSLHDSRPATVLGYFPCLCDEREIKGKTNWLQQKEKLIFTNTSTHSRGHGTRHHTPGLFNRSGTQEVNFKFQRLLSVFGHLARQAPNATLPRRLLPLHVSQRSCFSTVRALHKHC